MKKARKVSNFYGEVHFKRKQRPAIAFIGNTLPTEGSPVKAQRISLLIKLHAINMQLYQNWTLLRRPQQTIINKNK